jgi:hypothetical protein
MTEQPREPDDLFRLRPEEFTAARNALAKRLRSDGERERAAEVQALRKPTMTAWALNQVAREQPGVVDRVVHAGEGLRSAMEKAIGGDRSDFQSAQSEERRSIQEAVDAASTVMEAAGVRVTETSRQRMTDTLRAAAVDASVGDQLRRGVLVADTSAPGFGLEGVSADVLARQQRTDGREEPRQRERQARLDALKREFDKAEQRLREAVSAAEEAEERAVRLRREADEAERTFEVAKKRLDEEGGP